MEQYTWLEFIFFIVVILIVYYAVVFFKFYYPYLESKAKSIVNKEDSKVVDVIPAESNHFNNELNDNPFIKKLDIVEEKPSLEEININNSNISNNFNNFDHKDESTSDTLDQNVEESSSLNVLNSVFSSLPLAIQDEQEGTEEPDIDLTDILPETQELDFVDMNVTDMSTHIENNLIVDNENSFDTDQDEINEMKLDEPVHVEEANAYLDNEAGQLGFTFGDELSTSTNEQTNNEDIIVETPINKNVNSKEDNSMFDFNN